MLQHVPLDAKILDLGAYTGALISRLRANGYTRLLAADLANHLTEKVDDHWACDFNEDFSEAISERNFDAIVACEVIEHLDDPRAFLKQCRKLLKDGGHVVISTPNIAFFEGRIKFALTGNLWGFGERNYRSQRHISPIQEGQLPLMTAECGFDCIETTTAGSFATPMRRMLTAPIWLPMRAAFGPRTLGESLFCVARASASADETGSSGSTPWRVSVPAE
ncbi:class I SAM-dependent methyltransferase [Alteraurantiacibacter aestuarii]|uniref:Methyltransferase domain-containing protein n=1 Tax=Alteraurantiacibacter aestuarii TaxID=650004 RepID=A0A844ZKZ1_9SPHN|nr:methyltransferase domain-containing protein [Alteraurantiacibacter aestuarii]